MKTIFYILAFLLCAVLVIEMPRQRKKPKQKKLELTLGEKPAVMDSMTMVVDSAARKIQKNIIYLKHELKQND